MSRRRACIVEDEGPIRELLRLHLGLAGFVVDEIADGTLALERARATPFDLMMEERRSDWPELPLAAWQETYATLHRWTQIVGKTRLALAPMQNHWWQVTLYVTSRGLGTSPIPAGTRTFEVDFDFVERQLVVKTSDGRVARMPLQPMTVASFYQKYMSPIASSCPGWRSAYPTIAAGVSCRAGRRKSPSTFRC